MFKFHSIFVMESNQINQLADSIDLIFITSLLYIKLKLT